MILLQEKYFYSIGIALCLAITFVSCVSENNQKASSDKGSKYGGTFRVNEVQEIRTLDPAKLIDAPSHHVLHQIGELLLDLDSSLKLTPELAESWETSPDGLTYTYHLRKGVMFHNNPCFPNSKGREMKSSDVKYSFDRILDLREGAANATYFRDKVKGAIDYYKSTENLPYDSTPKVKGVSGFRVVDDYTFAIDLIKPFAPFKYYVVNGGCYVYPKEAVQKYGKDFFKNFVGTGPFELDHWVPQQELLLKKNQSYWGKDSKGGALPYLNELKWLFIKDEKQQINEFKLGNLEESYRIPTEFFKSVVGDDGKLTADWSGFILHRVPALSTQYYGMLCTSDIFKDKRIRQAFNYSVDRDRIIRYVLQGQAAGSAVHGLVPASMPNYNANSIKGYVYDLDKARALLTEAGYPNGQDFPEVTLNLNAGGGRNELVAEAIQEMISKGLGIKIKMKVLEWLNIKN
ncbi:MAG: ABC transporter substrate-binding protein [Chlorobiota bacterium]|nr:MAG: ABC transporter substrate-binding protein [Chlorobiota bacterium]